MQGRVDFWIWEEKGWYSPTTLPSNFELIIKNKKIAYGAFLAKVTHSQLLLICVSNKI